MYLNEQFNILSFKNAKTFLYFTVLILLCICFIEINNKKSIARQLYKFSISVCISAMRGGWSHCENFTNSPFRKRDVTCNGKEQSGMSACEKFSLFFRPFLLSHILFTFQPGAERGAARREKEREAVRGREHRAAAGGMFT